MHQNAFGGRALPGHTTGSLRSPKSPNWISKVGEWKEWENKGRGRDKRKGEGRGLRRGTHWKERVEREVGCGVD